MLRIPPLVIDDQSLSFAHVSGFVLRNSSALKSFSPSFISAFARQKRLRAKKNVFAYEENKIHSVPSHSRTFFNFGLFCNLDSLRITFIAANIATRCDGLLTLWKPFFPGYNFSTVVKLSNHFLRHRIWYGSPIHNWAQGAKSQREWKKSLLRKEY